MHAQKCEVCHEEASKYKCRQCELKYCSLKCFKVHKTTHEEVASAATESKKIKVEDGATNEIQSASSTAVKTEPAQPVNPYLALRSHPRFAPLFTKHPSLKSQLQRVYQASQNPYQNRLNDDPRPRIRDRVQGQWTQDKADEVAVKVLVDLSRNDEGVAEFMGLLIEVSRSRDGAKVKD